MPLLKVEAINKSPFGDIDDRQHKFTIKVGAGIQGNKGDKGDKGDEGPKGDKGEQGEQGVKGDKGDSDIDISKDYTDKARDANNTYSNASFIKKNQADTDLIFALTDSVGNLTDIQLDNNGQIANAVVGSWGKRLTPFLDSSFIPKTEISGSDLFALADADGNLSELQIDSNGKFPSAVLASWRERLNIPDAVEAVERFAPNYDKYLLPEMVGTSPAINEKDYYYKGGEFLPVMPDLNKVLYIGSSSAFRSKDSLALKFKTLNPNADFFGLTQGGAVIEHTNMLLGNKPMPLTFENNTIKGTGDSNVTYTLGTMAGFLDNNILNGWVSGVYGRLMHHPTNTGKYIFRRLEAGAAVALSGAEPIIPENGHKYRNAVQILWIGKNNMQSGFSVAVPTQLQHLLIIHAQ